MEPRALNLRELRKDAGMTMAQLAQATHFCLDYIWKLETGRAALSSEAQMRFAELFAPQPLKVMWNGRVWRLTLDNETPDDHPKPRRDPFAALNDTERIVRLAKECGDVKTCGDDLPRFLLNPQARREYVKRLLKEGIEADMILEALIANADPALLAEAAAMTEEELAAECGEVA